MKNSFFSVPGDLDSFEDLTAKFHPSYRDNTVDGYEEVTILNVLSYNYYHIKCAVLINS